MVQGYLGSRAREIRKGLGVIEWLDGWTSGWEDDIWVTETEGEGKIVDILKVERDLKVCFSRLGMHAHNGPLLSYK